MFKKIFVPFCIIAVCSSAQAQSGPSEKYLSRNEFSQLGLLVNVSTNRSMKFCTGKTIEGSTNWIQYSEQGLYVDVDTSSCGFTSTPIYLVNMHGNSNNWTATGGSSAYQRKPGSFRIYVRHAAADFTPAFANQRGWHIQWLAVGN
jgi:hypothetical protein